MLSMLTVLVAGTLANADIRPMLREQGFEGPLNGRETITYVGHIRQGRDDYQIYSYHGVFRAAAVDHGVNRLIIMRNGSTFFGQYYIPMPSRCEIRGQTVECNTTYPGLVVRFTGSGPPSQIWLDGEV